MYHLQIHLFIHLCGQFPIAPGQFPIARGQFPIVRGQFPIARGQFPIARGQFPIARSQFLIARVQFPIARGQFLITRSDFLLHVAISHHMWSFLIVCLAFHFSSIPISPPFSHIHMYTLSVSLCLSALVVKLEPKFNSSEHRISLAVSWFVYHFSRVYYHPHRGSLGLIETHTPCHSQGRPK